MTSKSRPPSHRLVDLHISIVPPEYWIQRLNYASQKVLDETISAGFIRVHPDATIFLLRGEIVKQIGRDLFPEQYVFLRHVGRCLALVHANQEHRLKAKDFTPPRSDLPEIFILPSRPPGYNSTPTLLPPHINADSLSPEHGNSARTIEAEYGDLDPFHPITDLIPYSTGEHEEEKADEGLLYELFENDVPERFIPGENERIEKNNHVNGRKKTDRLFVAASGTDFSRPEMVSGYDVGDGSLSDALIVNAVSKERPYTPSDGSNETEDLPFLSPRGRVGLLASKDGRSTIVSTKTELTDTRPGGFADIRREPAMKFHYSPSSGSLSSENLSHTEHYADSNSYQSKKRKPLKEVEYITHNNTAELLELDPAELGRRDATGKSSYEARNIGDNELSPTHRPEDQYHFGTAYNREEEDPVYDIPDQNIGGSGDSPGVGNSTKTTQKSQQDILTPNFLATTSKSTVIPSSKINIQDSHQGILTSDFPATPSRGVVIGSPKLTIRESHQAIVTSDYDPTTPSKGTVIESSTLSILKSQQAFVTSNLLPTPSNSTDSPDGIHPRETARPSSRDYDKSVVDHDSDQILLPDHGRPLGRNETSNISGEFFKRKPIKAKNSPNLSSMQPSFPASHQPISINDSASRASSTTSNMHRLDTLFDLVSTKNGTVDLTNPVKTEIDDDQSSRSSSRTEQSYGSVHLQNHAEASFSLELNEMEDEQTMPKTNFASPTATVLSTLQPDGYLKPIEDQAVWPSEKNDDFPAVVPTSSGDPVGSRNRGYPDGLHDANSKTAFQIEPGGEIHIEENSSNSLHGRAASRELRNEVTEKATAISNEMGDHSQPQNRNGIMLARGNVTFERGIPSAKFDTVERKRKLWQELHCVREQRKHSERSRQEIMRDAKKTAKEIIHKRAGARDVWKRRFYHEKKKMTSLNEVFSRLAHQHDSFSKTFASSHESVLVKSTNSLTHRQERPSLKINSKIQAVQILQSIANLKKKIADAKAKLAVEVKMRYEAEQEVKQMKRGLLSKKIQSHVAYRKINNMKELDSVPRGLVTRNHATMYHGHRR